MNGRNQPFYPWKSNKFTSGLRNKHPYPVRRFCSFYETWSFREGHFKWYDLGKFYPNIHKLREFISGYDSERKSYYA